jgi:hypothetical protein
MKHSHYKIFFLKIFLVFGSLLMTISAISQMKDSEIYLIIRFEKFYDNTNQRTFYVINAERGCDNASAIYSLLKYDAKKNALNQDGDFYFKTKTVNDSLFNYFLSPTEGLNFMSANEWQLISVFSETSSNYNNQRKGSGELVPITTVSSSPVFCFRK